MMWWVKMSGIAPFTLIFSIFKKKKRELEEKKHHKIEKLQVISSDNMETLHLKMN